MPKTTNRSNKKFPGDASRAGKRAAGGPKARFSAARSQRSDAVQPYWWILRGGRPDEP